MNPAVALGGRSACDRTSRVKSPKSLVVHASGSAELPLLCLGMRA
jgi:hypothetical protein